ncbi:MAG: glycosyltransferase [Candidatus Omnitrophica bacterium]|nr:glycosyltransferase [Candidatus Omnitrophota bacterium]
MRSLEDYYEIVGDMPISNIHKKARKLYGKRILHINSTCQGGGVAGILASLIPLMNDIGIEVGWRILHGNPDFFSITKKFHNALQGEQINLSEIKKRLYIQANELFSLYTHINHNCVLIHDPQPLPLIKFYKKKQPWIWRCHIDLSHPDKEVWDFLKRFILGYDAAILSNEKYKSKHLSIEQKVIHPAIDPLSAKNKQLSESDILKYLKKFKVPTDKPLIVQVSRFDKWKDPLGVIEIFKLVKKEVDCRLVLCGSMAADDPEGWVIYEKVKKEASQFIANKDVIFITSENSILVNALQRSSAVIIQKSIREGFGLTVTEALWKEKPVVAANVGGIPLQIDNGKNGFLLEPLDTKGFTQRIVQILKNPKLAEKMGKRGKQVVKEKFLITRLLSDYLDLLNAVME